MAKFNPKLVTQHNFPFAVYPPMTSLVDLKNSLSLTIKKQTTREALSVYLTDLLGKTVSVTTINNWMAESKKHIPPVHLLLPICNFCHDFTPIKVLFAPYDLTLLTAKEKVIFEFGKLTIKEEKLTAKRNSLNSKIKQSYLGDIDES